MARSTELTVELRGETVTITDVSIWADPPVGIPLHLDGFSLVNAAGKVLDWELTEQEEKIVDDAVWKQYEKDEAEIAAQLEGLEEEFE